MDKRPAPLVAKQGLPLQKPSAAAQYLKVLVYGRPGVGKTYFAGTAEDDPRTAPVLFADVEGGVLTISHRGEALDVFRINDFGDDLEALFGFLSSGQHEYKSVVIDSLTELQKASMRGIMRKAIQTQPGRDPDSPMLQEWGKNLEQVRRVVRAFRDLPIHVIMTALEVESKDDRTGEVTVSPSLSGKLASEVSGFFDIVGRLHTVAASSRDAEGNRQVTVTRRLLVSSTTKFIAKDRSGRLGIEVENPTIPMLLEQVFATRQ